MGFTFIKLDNVFTFMEMRFRINFEITSKKECEITIREGLGENTHTYPSRNVPFSIIRQLLGIATEFTETSATPDESWQSFCNSFGDHINYRKTLETDTATTAFAITKIIEPHCNDCSCYFWISVEKSPGGLRRGFSIPLFDDDDLNCLKRCLTELLNYRDDIYGEKSDNSQAEYRTLMEDLRLFKMEAESLVPFIKNLDSNKLDILEKQLSKNEAYLKEKAASIPEHCTEAKHTVADAQRALQEVKTAFENRTKKRNNSPLGFDGIL